ncbi:ATP-binding protein [Nocardia nova]|uniref:ATP-binding protein n=1 Tax=Nocardia nova TaxID=37330 RepID=UPI000CE9CC76|nr:LuxR C-terminal-related transcriptional regulator [Nocardia nova]PPJ21611.1 LuxR family transcriptional regulator [Nocardia nova]
MAMPVTSLGSSGALPADFTNFIGRRHERTQVKQLLSQSRLVTLTGFGGVGKTRLSQRVSVDLSRAFRDGVVFVDLAPITDPTLLVDTIAKAFGFHTPASNRTTTYIFEQLRARVVLIVLDNCEHLIDACAKLVDAMLRGCPGVHVLATSREPLGITGEVVLPVAPFTVPPKDAQVRGQMTEYDSVTLFVERAQAAVPGFQITDENREHVADICRRLDGIPLALELAAVRLRGLTPAQLVDRLTDQFQLLNAGSRAAQSRQRTLRDCIEWSYNLCSPDERRLWAQASVFSGGFELDAAEAVCMTDEGAGADVLNTLLALVEKSILISEEVDGQMRYRMLEVIRQYGAQCLREIGEEHTIRIRHRDFFADLVHRSEPEWAGSGQRLWIGRLRRNHANIQAALACCAAGPAEEAEIGLQIASGLRDHWINLGTLSEGTYWIELLLQHGPCATRTHLSALRTMSWTALIHGESDYAKSCIDKGLQLSKSSGTAAADFDTLCALYRIFEGDCAEAIVYATQALEVARATSDPALEMISLIAMQFAHHYLGDIEQWLRWHAECLRLAERIGDTWYLSYSLWDAGLGRFEHGDVEAATETLRRSLQIQQEMANRLGVAIGIESLAWVRASVDPREGATLLGAAAARWRSVGGSVTAAALLADRHERCVATLQSTLGNQDLAALMDSGARLDYAEAIDIAMGRPRGERRSGGKPSERAATQLTRREREVAGLVGRGLSNREIAQTLVIAQRTAETHVERILTKLGFTTRAQIAAWLADQQRSN